MIEGLWVLKWLLPTDVGGDLTGGVAVIETNRLYGGDSGYIFVGDVTPNGQNVWSLDVTVTRHDPNIDSLFGDLDQFHLTGTLRPDKADSPDGVTMVADFPMSDGPALGVAMRKVAELPG